MNITIDCRLFNESGIGVYLRECLPYFLASSHTFLLMGDTEKLDPLVKDYQNCKTIHCDSNSFSIPELIAFPSVLKKTINQTDLYYSPYFNIPGGIKVPIYTTIHDIIFLDMPELTSQIGLAARMWFYHRAFRLSKKIFTVSHFSKSRIEHFFGNTKPVIVTHSAIQPYLLKRDPSQVKKKKIILFTGNIKKHKGLWCLLDAFFLARDEGLEHKLVIVGENNHFRSTDTEVLAKLAHIDPSIEFTGRISNEKLRILLTEAALLVQPSLYEGFGLPPLEAMTVGTQVLISDIPVFKEIYAGFPVFFFHAGDSVDLKEKMLACLHHKNHIILPENLAVRYTFQKTTSIILQNLTSV